MHKSAKILLVFCCLLTAAWGAEPSSDTVLALLSRAQKSLAQGEHQESLRRYRTIARLYPRTDWAATACWQIARLENHLGDKQAAFDALQVLVTSHPGHFEDAHADQLALARSLMDADAQRERLRGLETPRKGKALREEEQAMLAGMLQTIIRNGPYSEVAQQAHFDFAVMLERAGRLPEALLMHEEFLDSHASHELADDAACQAAYIRYKQWKMMQGAAPRQRDAARDALAWFLGRYPQSERAAVARACLAEVRQSERRELESLARFYESSGKPEAAAVYWKELAAKFPELAQSGQPLRQKIAEAVSRPSPAPPPEARGVRVPAR